MLKKQVFLLLFLAFISTIKAQQLAFPTAEGGGRLSLGGRGGTVYQVTNLNDAGTGSLRDAVSQPNRTVVFRVSGTIVLLSRLVLRQNNITIAGQTAPGDGICISGNTLNIQASNIIIRYLRCRLGDAFPDVTTDNWAKGIQKDSYINAAALLTAAKQANPFPVSPVQTQTAEAAFLSVLDSAGAILPCRDTVDRRIVRETRTGTATFEGPTYGLITATGISHPSGIIDKLTDVGGAPIYNSTPAPTDTDADGMPDSWEIGRGLNPSNAADRNTLINGYTNLEVYLNSITSPCAPRVGTNDILKTSVFELANNPVGNVLVINHLNLNTNAVFSVYDLNGVKLLTQKISNTDKTSLDVSALKSGFYIVECQTSSGKRVLKFVKQ